MKSQLDGQGSVENASADRRSVDDVGDEYGVLRSSLHTRAGGVRRRGVETWRPSQPSVSRCFQSLGKSRESQSQVLRLHFAGVPRGAR